MELNATKKYIDIINLLESLEERIEAEIENLQEELTQKYSLDITQEILQYVANFIKMKINLIINDFIREFNSYSIIIDCTEINLNMYEIEAMLRQVKRKMKDTIPKDPESEDIQIILKKYLRKVVCRIPTQWTEPVVLKFLKQFEDTLNKLGIVIS